MRPTEADRINDLAERMVINGGCCDDDEEEEVEICEEDQEEDQPQVNGVHEESAETKKLHNAIKNESMQAELKHLERRYNDKGHTYIVEQKDEVLPEQINWWEKYALCVTRQMDRSNRFVQNTQLQVNSQHLKDLLNNVIGTFPGISFSTKNISIDFPPRCLFHYREELRQHGAKFDKNSEAAAHVELLLNFIDSEFEETITETNNLLGQGLMSYEYLWTIFKPGHIIFSHSLGQPRAFQLLSYQYSGGLCPSLALSVSFVDYDGESFGTRQQSVCVPQYIGTEQINMLAAYPFSFHASPEEMRNALVTRGRRFERYLGQNFCCYSGIALLGMVRYNIRGRVMIDCKTYHRLNANEAFSVTAFKNADSAELTKRKRTLLAETQLLAPQRAVQLPPLTDEQCLMANAMVRGFSFSEKSFLNFFVDGLSAVDWNSGCFDQLVLPDSQKELVRALVSNHSQSSIDFDDIVKGKGKGLILVLHGPPGVGKTLTAECVAEFARRPLYIVSSGDLGTDSSTLDQRLSRILDMASTWKAVLLIDEADVFLERRSLHDMERNSLVSIFLRVLEYYEGILFLTTNRVQTFDDAFKSRIHVPLKYGNLPESSRKRIWKNFLEQHGSADVDIDEAGYDALAKGELNGRQIKNIIRTAKSLAQYKGEKLNRAQLEQVMHIQMEFEDELDVRPE